MPHSIPTNKIARICIIIFFLCGSSAIAYQFYQNAYDDLPSFYWATRLAFDEQLSAYKPQYFQQIGQSLDRKIYPFLYPPPALLLFSPFLLGDYDQWKLILTVTNLLLWWLLAFGFYRLYCFHRDVTQHDIAALLIPLWLLCFVPIWDVFRTGQINLFVLMCAMPFFFDSPRRCWQIMNGVLIGLIVVLKVYMLLVLPMLLLLDKKITLLAACATLVFLCLLSVMVLPSGLWTDWFELSRVSGGYGKQWLGMMTIPWNQSINGFFIRQFLDERILSGATYWPLVAYACSGLLAATTFYVIVKKLNNHVSGSALAMALVFLVVILIAPLTWFHHFVFAIPSVICCYALLNRCDVPKPQKNLLVIGITTVVLAMGSWPLARPLFPFLPPLEIVNKTVTLAANMAASVPLLAAAVFFMILCCVLSGRKMA